jgi:hypothetical protein
MEHRLRDRGVQCVESESVSVVRFMRAGPSSARRRSIWAHLASPLLFKIHFYRRHIRHASCN